MFLLELLYEDRQPQIDASRFKECTILNPVHSSSYMFHKENLWMIMSKRLPDKYTKIAFLDGDVLFESPLRWAHKVSLSLDTHDVVHPFSEPHRQSGCKDEVPDRNKRLSVARDKKNGHEGFGIAVVRSWLNTYPLNETCLVGSGDSYTLGKTTPKQTVTYCARDEIHYLRYHIKDLGYVDEIGVHLFHGETKNRLYSDRHKLFAFKFSDAREQNITDDDIVLNDEGVYEWKDPLNSSIMYEFFKNRREDEGLNDEYYFCISLKDGK